MKKVHFLFCLFLLAAPLPALADLYQWEDREGVVHITDDIKKIPDAYRNKVKTLKTAPPAPEPRANVQEPVPSPKPSDKGEELYGDQTLEWWRQTLTRKRDEVQMLEASVSAKKQYMQVFEGGRRLGQTYTSTEVDTYQRYKKELPTDEQRLSVLKDELDELRRDARLAGVPRDIRGE